MTTIVSEILIRKPRPVVFDYLTDLLDRLFLRRPTAAESATALSRLQNAFESA